MRHIKIRQTALAWLLALQHAKPVLNAGGRRLTLDLSVNHLSFQVKVELAAGSNTQTTADLNRNDHLAFF